VRLEEDEALVLDEALERLDIAPALPLGELFVRAVALGLAAVELPIRLAVTADLTLFATPEALLANPLTADVLLLVVLDAAELGLAVPVDFFEVLPELRP